MLCLFISLSSLTFHHNTLSTTVHLGLNWSRYIVTILDGGDSVDFLTTRFIPKFASKFTRKISLWNYYCGSVFVDILFQLTIITIVIVINNNNNVMINDNNKCSRTQHSPASMKCLFVSPQTLSFRSLRVAVPLMLVVNKRPVTASQIATSQIVSQQKPE